VPKSLLPLRIIVVGPPAGVTFALQRGRDQLEPPVVATPDAVWFDFDVEVADAAANPPRLVGDFAQGPPGARFVYVNSGTMAGQTESCWTRRAKVPLASIDAELVHETLAHTGTVLQARVFGRSRDGGPACASVKLLEGWTPVRR
jgi:hypothetical protein